MFRFFIFSCFLLVFSACQQTHEPEKPKGLLRISTVPVDMPIIVNGQPKGNSPSGAGQYFSISLEEGEHKIEILKSINDEKEHYAEKTFFLAADTVPIITLEAKERLTPFGEAEDARREAEEAEKQRVAEIERQKAEKLAANRREVAAKKKRELHKKMQEKNQLHRQTLEKSVIVIGERAYDGDKVSFSYSVDGCSMNIEEKYPDGDKRMNAVNAGSLEISASTTGKKEKIKIPAFFGEYQVRQGKEYSIICKKNTKCITSWWTDSDNKWKDSSRVYLSVTEYETHENNPETQANQVNQLVNALKSVISNCQ